MVSVSDILNTIDKINCWIGRVLYLFILLISIVVLIGIISRYVFSYSIIWTFETTQFLFLICTFLAAGHLQKHQAHVKVDIIYDKLSRKTQLICDLVTFPFFVFFVGAMTYFGFHFGFESLLKNETTGSAWDPPIYPFKLLVPLGALLLLLQGFSSLIKSIIDYKKHKS